MAGTSVESAQSAHRSCLVWHRVPAAPAGPRPPLVVLLSWVNARPDIVRKYVELYNSHGCDVAVYLSPVLSMWMPAWAAWSAQAILTALTTELRTSGPKPLVFAVFSGAAKAAYYKLLQLLCPGVPVISARPQTPVPGPAMSTSSPDACSDPATASALSSTTAAAPRRWLLWGRRTSPTPPTPLAAGPPPPLPPCRFPEVQLCFSGQMLDSSPVDFTSQAGVKLVVPDNSAKGSKGNNNSSVKSLGSSLQQASALSAAADSADLPPSSPTTTATTTRTALGRGAAAAASLAESARLTAAQVAAGILDFTLIEWFELQRRELWGTLEQLAPANLPVGTSGSGAVTGAGAAGVAATPLGPGPASLEASCEPTAAVQPAPAVPTLLLYSWNDPLANPLPIHCLASALRARGGVVLEQAWDDSQHVGHLKAHPEQYRAMVGQLLEAARRLWHQRQEQSCRQGLLPEGAACLQAKLQAPRLQLKEGLVGVSPATGSGQVAKPMMPTARLCKAGDDTGEVVLHLASMNSEVIRARTEALLQLQRGVAAAAQGRQLRSKL